LLSIAAGQAARSSPPLATGDLCAASVAGSRDTRWGRLRVGARARRAPARAANRSAVRPVGHGSPVRHCARGAPMIHLREVRRDDVPAINTWRGDRALVDGLGAPFRYIGPEVDASWFDAYLARR